MSDNIDIRIREDGSRVVSRNLDDIANKADKAADAVVDMNKRITSSSGNTTALTKLQSLIKMAESYGTGMVKQLDQTSSSYRNTLMKHFEMVSRSARASAASIKSQMEVLTATPVGMGSLNAYFKEQENAAKKLAASEAAFVNGAAARLAKQENDERVSNDRRLAAALKKVEMQRAAEASYTTWWSAELKKRDLADAARLKGTVLTPKTMNASGATGDGSKSVNALAASHSTLTNAISGSTARQSEWNRLAADGHAAARGLSGSLGTLWMTYGSIAPLLAGAAIGAVFKEATAKGAEFA